MKVFIRRSGGIANIQIEGDVDTAELTGELAEQAERLLKSENLRKICSRDQKRMPDRYQYEIRVGEGDKFEAFSLDDSMAEPDFLDVLDGLIVEIKARRRLGDD